VLFLIEFLRRTNNKTTASAQETFECKYGSVTVEVTQGDITIDKSEAIINGCGSDFNLDWGKLRKKLLMCRRLHNFCEVVSLSNHNRAETRHANGLGCFASIITTKLAFVKILLLSRNQ